jgi:ribonucleoside-diphosphate reductase alpha chain
MKVRNRDGVSMDVSYDEIKSRITKLCADSEDISDMRELDVDQVIIRTIQGIYDGISTAELDDLSSRICVSLQSTHHAYDTLAGCILMSNIHKNVNHRVMASQNERITFSHKVGYINHCMPTTYAPDFLAFVREHASALDAMIDYRRDMRYNYFSVRTMERGYLIKIDGACIESPQDMWMRVSVAINCPRRRGRSEVPDAAKGQDKGEEEDVATVLARVHRCYDAMSEGLFTHATPTLFNAGTAYEQMSSCYLVGTDDSLDGIYHTLSNCAQISKWAGGIGVHASNVRAKGGRIKSTNGISDGIIPMLKVFNETARYCNQSGRRKGSICVYLEPWHADVWEFVELRKNTGVETDRARDLFLALWVPDLFMRAVIDDTDWHLMSPDASPGLQDVHGDEFDALYARYVAEGRFVRKVRAQSLWQHVLQCQLETGVPYVMFKDSVNAKCNQKNLGTIRSSNLCAEITEYSDSQTYAVCNLASIAANRFLRPDGTYDHALLHETAKVITRNLNRVIDANFYPTPETRQSNTDARPIGIGVQGLADLYCSMGLVYEDEAAMDLDAAIMETIYHGALEASVELAREQGPYPRFAGSPFSEGKLQMDLWVEAQQRQMLQHDSNDLNDSNDLKTRIAHPVRYSGRWDWDAMRQAVRTHGTRNSMLTALMPTASTSQILGNSECFEPPHSNVFKRRTLAGEFMVVNKVLMTELMRVGLWTEDMRRALMDNDGSLQKLNTPGISDAMKAVYKTVWEIPQKAIINHAVARAPFVDQSQSMNLFFDVPNAKKLNSALIYAWRSGLKTGLYYLRSLPAAEASKVSSTSSDPVAAKRAADVVNDTSRREHTTTTTNGDPACSLGTGCEACGS